MKSSTLTTSMTTVYVLIFPYFEEPPLLEVTVEEAELDVLEGGSTVFRLVDLTVGVCMVTLLRLEVVE